MEAAGETPQGCHLPLRGTPRSGITLSPIPQGLVPGVPAEEGYSGGCRGPAGSAGVAVEQRSPPLPDRSLPLEDNTNPAEPAEKHPLPSAAMSCIGSSGAFGNGTAHAAPTDLQVQPELAGK